MIFRDNRERNSKIHQLIADYTKKHTRSPAAARAALIREGLHDADGNLMPEYGGKKRRSVGPFDIEKEHNMLDTMCDVMRTAYERGWISTRDGNISLRRQNSPYLYVTPTGVRKQTMTSESILKLRFPEDREQPQAWRAMTRVDDEYQRRIIGLNPSGELPMHYLLQKNVNTSNRVVLHLHPTHIIAAMYAGLDLQKIAAQFPELYIHTKVGPTVGSVQAQSQELGENVYSAFDPDETGRSNWDICGIHLHGVVAVDRDPWQAYGHVERLNHICEIVLAAGGMREQV